MQFGRTGPRAHGGPDSANQNLRALSARLLQLQDEERRRFAGIAEVRPVADGAYIKSVCRANWTCHSGYLVFDSSNLVFRIDRLLSGHAF